MKLSQDIPESKNQIMSKEKRYIWKKLKKLKKNIGINTV